MAQTNKMINKERLAYRLKAMRRVAGYSMMDVAVNANMSDSQVYNYENCKTVPSLDTMIKYSILYGVSIDCILEGCINEDGMYK